MPPSAGSRSEHSHHSGYDDDETLMLEQAMDKADRASNRLEAIRAQALRDARDAERGDFRVAAPAPANAKADAREMASLVGQLERYAEAKTGRASSRTTGLRPYDDDEDAFDALGGSNLANRASRSARSGAETLAAPKRAAPPQTGANRWGARRSANAAASTRRNGGHASYGMGPGPSGDVVGVGDYVRFEDENRPKDGEHVDPTYQNSLVGGWDAGSRSSRWETSSVPDSDVRSVYSAALEDSFGGAYALPDAPADEVSRVDERAGAAAENLERQRAALERQMSRIARATRASDAAASLETDGMFTAGKTKTGVGVIDFFARDPGGAGPKGSLAKSVNERAMNDAKNKWLSPAPARTRHGRTTAPPEEPSPIVRMLRSVFGCGCGGR